MNIGFFDSGIGGLTVLAETRKLLPKENYAYYADTAHAPFGTKTRQEVHGYVMNAVDFLVKQHMDIIVIACNTATSIAIEDLRARYSIPIVGMEPAVKPAVTLNKKHKKRVLVTATPLTLQEEKLKLLLARIDDDQSVDLLPLPKLVTYAQSWEFTPEVIRTYLKEQLPKDLSPYGTIVLGCTHFIYYKHIFRELLPADIEIIDGNLGTAMNILHIAEKRGPLGQGNGKIVFYDSGTVILDTKKIAGYQELLGRM